MQIRASPLSTLLSIVQFPNIIESQDKSEVSDQNTRFVRELIMFRHNPPLLSGFFRLKSSNAFSSIRAWKERWLVMTKDDTANFMIYIHRKRCGKDYSAKQFKTLLVYPQHCVVENARNGSGSFCFSFSTAEGRRVILAATSEFQMWSWISNIRSISDESLTTSTTLSAPTIT